MVKCGACGKFLNRNETIRCGRCPTAYHKACVGVPDSGTVSGAWACPACKAKVPKVDNSSTPIKGLADGFVISDSISGEESQDEIAQRTTTVETENSLLVEMRLIRSEINAMRAELRSEIQEHRAMIASEIGSMRAEVKAEISEYQKNLESFRISLQENSEKCISMEDRLTVLEKKFEEHAPSGVEPLEDTIQELKVQLNERDQELLQNNVVITGLPESQNECLLHIVKLMSAQMGLDMDEKDIVDVNRIGLSHRNRLDTSADSGSALSRPRPIAVRFARRATRDQWLRVARVRRLFVTTDLALTCPSAKYYINEHLTHVYSQLFYRAREEARKRDWKYVWTRDGNILIRKDDGSKVFRVRCDKDLSKFFGHRLV